MVFIHLTLLIEWGGNRPSAENLDAYLGGIVRIDGALQEMRENNLTFCEVTLRRLVTRHYN